MPRRIGREQVVRAALEVLDEVGLDGLTLGAVAGRLNVRAPALYWHFAGKQDLLDEMATQLWREVVAAAAGGPGQDWRGSMRHFARTLRSTLLAHRDGAKLFSGTYLTDVSVLEAQEAPLAGLVATGFDLADAIDMSHLLYAYVIGSTIEEQAVRQTAEIDDRYRLERREERLDPERFPLMTAAGRLTFADPDHRFERILDLLVESFATRRGQP